MCGLQNWTSQVALSDPPADWSCHRRQPTDQKWSSSSRCRSSSSSRCRSSRSSSSSSMDRAQVRRWFSIKEAAPGASPACIRTRLKQAQSLPTDRSGIFSSWSNMVALLLLVNKVARQNWCQDTQGKWSAISAGWIVKTISVLLESNNLHTKISLCAPISDSGTVVIANF